MKIIELDIQDPLTIEALLLAHDTGDPTRGLQGFTSLLIE